MLLLLSLQTADHPSYKDGESLQHIWTLEILLLGFFCCKFHKVVVHVVVFGSVVPGPCDPEDLLDGVIFGAKYLGSTQIKSDKNPSTNARMKQAQEAVDRIKVMSSRGAHWTDVQPRRLLCSFVLVQGYENTCFCKIQIPLLWHQLCFCLFQAPEGESQPMTEVDLFISTQRIKVLTADTQVPFLAAWNKLIKMYQIVLNFLYYIILCHSFTVIIWFAAHRAASSV